MKWCTNCKSSKSFEAFNKRGRGGLRSNCRDCEKQKGRAYRNGKGKAVQRAYHYRRRIALGGQGICDGHNTKFVKGFMLCFHCFESRLRHKYGIGLAEWNRAYLRQMGLCANERCRSPGSHLLDSTVSKNQKLKTDHSHKTGKFRALLCHKCNVWLGVIEKNPDQIGGLFQYAAAGSLCSQA